MGCSKCNSEREHSGIRNSKLPTNESPGLDCFTGELYQTYGELTSILLTLFQKKKTEEERVLPKSLYKEIFILIPKPNTVQKNYRSVYLMNIDAKNPQNISKLIPTIHRKNRSPQSSWIYFRVTRMVQ